MSSKKEDKKVKPAGKRPLVPKLRFPEFRDAGEWEVKPIGQISENVIAGGTPITSEKKYWGGSIRWMNSGELNLKKVYEVKGRITEAGLQNSSTKVIPKKCVLIGLAGQGKTRGTIAMNMVELCINQSIAAIFPNEKCFSSAFLYHNLDNRYDELRSLSTGGEGRGGLNLQIIKSLGVPLPELKEQQKIADCLSSLDELISLEAQRLDALKAHKKGMMQRLFPGKGETVPRLRFPEFRDAGEWEVVPLGRLGLFFRGLTYGADDVADEGLLVLRSSNIQEGRLILDSDLVFVKKSCPPELRLRRGDIVVCMSNGSKALVGKSGELDHDYPGELTAGAFCSIFRPLTIFSKIAFQTPRYANFVATGLAGGNINNLKNSDLEGFELHVPRSPAEQTRIADFLSSLDGLITAQTDRLAALKTHKKGLMQQLFPVLNEIEQQGL